MLDGDVRLRAKVCSQQLAHLGGSLAISPVSHRRWVQLPSEWLLIVIHALSAEHAFSARNSRCCVSACRVGVVVACRHSSERAAPKQWLSSDLSYCSATAAPAGRRFGLRHVAEYLDNHTVCHLHVQLEVGAVADVGRGCTACFLMAMYSSCRNEY